jgi:hypothetical protein
VLHPAGVEPAPDAVAGGAHGPSRAEAGRADLEAFAPASPETFGLRALLARPKPGPGSLDDDLFHGRWPTGASPACAAGANETSTA